MLELEVILSVPVPPAVRTVPAYRFSKVESKDDERGESQSYYQSCV